MGVHYTEKQEQKIIKKINRELFSCKHKKCSHLVEYVAKKMKIPTSKVRGLLYNEYGRADQITDYLLKYYREV